LETPITILHFIRGRVRLRVSCITHSIERSRALEDGVRSASGIITVRVNPLTSTVLVTYDPGMLGVAEVLSIVESALPPSRPFPPIQGGDARILEAYPSFNAVVGGDDLASRVVSAFAWKAAEIAAVHLIAALV
jgi:hypothetical protein